MNSVYALIIKTLKTVYHALTIYPVKLLNLIMREKLPYYCPCCDTCLKRFVDGKYDRHPTIFDLKRYEGMDQSVLCPICHSLPRHRILVSWMNQNIDKIRGKDILHFAQERALKLWMNRNRIVPVTADLYRPADLKLDIEDTGLKSDSYDLVICNHVLEHVSDYTKALVELRRIIRPGGSLIISFPVDQRYETVYESNENLSEQERIHRFGQRDHMRVFGTDSPDMLKRFGFELTEIRGDDCDVKIKPIIGPADYDYNVLWVLKKQKNPGPE